MTPNALPAVSVIVPSYNCSQFIAESLNSILDQQYPNLEVIVVDDGSTDGTAEIAEAYGSPVKVVRQKNQGPAAARNRAAREATGDYLAFLDGDDLWLPEKLLTQMQHMVANPDIEIVYGGFKRWCIDRNGCYPPVETLQTDQTRQGIDTDLSGWIYHKLLMDNYIHIITAVISRQLYEKLGGFDETLRVGEDYDFWLRASQQVKVHKLARDVSLYRVNPTSTTHVPRPVNSEHLVLLRAIDRFGYASPDGAHISDEQLRCRLFNLSFGFAYLHYWHGSVCIAAQYFKEALKYRKNILKTVLYLLLANIRCFWQPKKSGS